MNQLARTAIYMRLSRDDEKAGESTSIEHQRIILQKYVQERQGIIVKEYIDDGWSGTDFDRPAIKNLLGDAKLGKIDTIVVKDLSRFGRNYIQVGQYIDYIFPAYGIRFIAISDNVDTSDRSSAAMDMMPIMNVFNEWHAANTSKKIKAVLEASQRAGKYTSSIYPYGYKAGSDENRTAIIDARAAEVVRRIFALRAEGKSLQAIARILSDDKIPNPATYFTRLDGKKTEKNFSPFWCPSTVASILSNSTYIGQTVQHKTTNVSYKNHKTVNLPKSERIIKENAHEAIIGVDLWNKVQTVNNSLSHGKADKKNAVHSLSGLLVCADCGKKLKFKSSGGHSGFVCRTYVDLGKKYCTSHSISEKAIESVVLQDIKSLTADMEIDKDKVKERFFRNAAKSIDKGKYSAENRLKAQNARLAELNKLLRAAFEEKVSGNLPESVCITLCEQYRKEICELEEEIGKSEQSFSKDIDASAAENYAQKLKYYCKSENLTREICLQLINFITIGEARKDGERTIHVYYNFADK